MSFIYIYRERERERELKTELYVSILYEIFIIILWASLVAQMENNVPANAGDLDFIPG